MHLPQVGLWVSIGSNKCIYMFMVLNIADIVPLIIVFQSALFALVLLTDRGPKRTSNRFLAVFLSLLGLQFAAITSVSLGGGSGLVASSFCVYGFLYGPVLFLYARSLVYKNYQIRISQLLHLIPAAVFVLFAALGHSLCRALGALLYVSLLAYIILTVKVLVKYRKVIRETQSSNARMDLKWLQWTMVIFSITLLLDMVDQFLLPLDVWAGISAIHLAILLLINWIFYKGLKQPQIFSGISESDEWLASNSSKRPVSKMPDEEEREELERIKTYMQSSRAFTNAELSLTELASVLDISPRKLSYLINGFLDQNFVGFVNQYRIEMAQDRLMHSSEKGETILEIMYEVGFNSKSSFNTLFKQYTGLTPSDFKKKQGQS